MDLPRFLGYPDQCQTRANLAYSESLGGSQAQGVIGAVRYKGRSV